MPHAADKTQGFHCLTYISHAITSPRVVGQDLIGNLNTYATCNYGNYRFDGSCLIKFQKDVCYTGASKIYKIVNTFQPQLFAERIIN